MKYLQDYIEEAQTKLFNDTGAFFAFSTEQFEREARKGVKYVNCGMGLIAPKENVKRLLEGLDLIAKEGIKQDIKENGIDNIIGRELYNHEAFYTGSAESTIEALDGYNIPLKDVKRVYKKLWEIERAKKN